VSQLPDVAPSATNVEEDAEMEESTGLAAAISNAADQVGILSFILGSLVF